MAHTRTHAEDHPGLVAVSVPAEAHRFEVFKGGEAEELVTEFIVWHHRIDPRGIRTIGRDGNRYSLDSARADPHVLSGIPATIVRIEIDVEITPISEVSNVLDIIIDSDRIGVIGQHGL